MMDVSAMRHRLCVAMGDEGLLCEYRKKIESDRSFVLTGAHSESVSLLEDLTRLRMDSLILQDTLTDMDALRVLERIRCLEQSCRPWIAVLCTTGNDMLTGRLYAGKANWIIKDRYTPERILERIRWHGRLRREKTANLPDIRAAMRDYGQYAAVQEVFTRKETVSVPAPYDGSPLEAAVWIMRSIGIGVHLPGYRYILDALQIYLCHDHHLPSVTKMIYPMIGEQRSLDSAHIERSIRHAVDHAWTRGDLRRIQSLFGEYIDGNGSGKPGNAQFLALMADKVRDLSPPRRV